MNETIIIAFLSASYAVINRHLKVDYKFKRFLCKNIKEFIPDGLRDLTKDLMIRQCTNDQSSFTYIYRILQRGNLFKFQLTRVCLLLLVSAPATWIDMHSYDTSKRKLCNKGCEPPSYFKQQIILELHNPINIKNKNNKFHLLIMSFDAFQFTLRQNVLARVVTITIRKWHIFKRMLSLRQQQY